MNITVLTPDREIFDGPIVSVKVPGTNGNFQILKDHAAIVSSLKDGEISIKQEGGQMLEFSIEKGFIEVNNNKISLLVQGVKGI